MDLPNCRFYWPPVEGEAKVGRGSPSALGGAELHFSWPLQPGPQHSSPRWGPYHDHLRRDGEADPVHITSVEFLHQHQEDATDEGEDERGDVGVGEVFANVNEGLGERAPCSWTPTSSSCAIPTLGCLTQWKDVVNVNGGTPKQYSDPGLPQLPIFLLPLPKGLLGVHAKCGNADSFSLFL